MTAEESASAGSVTKVVESGCCVGCGACGVATSGRITIPVSALGIRQAKLEGADEKDLAIASAVCPFADESPDETAISEELFPGLEQHNVLGAYSSVRAGRVSDDNYVTGSSSGGMTSWIVRRLLEKGLVDGVVHVGAANDDLFEYQVSDSVEQATSRRKSVYFSTSMADAVNSVRGDGRRYAFVGVPCFVTALRHVMNEDAELASQFPFLVGLVCGHLKSRAFARLLAWQLGVEPAELEAVDFRVKRPGHDAADYAFGAKPRGRAMVTGVNRELVGANWGHTMMQLSACDFCDDIFAETADVVLGDAWLEEYRQDWRGTNVVVSRRAEIDEILDEGTADGSLTLEFIAADRAAASQSGNFRHRRVGLSVRLQDDIERGRWVPRKRVEPGQYGVAQRRRDLIRQRRRIGELSHIAFAAALDSGNLRRDFLRPIGREVARYQALEYGPVIGGLLARFPFLLRSRLLRGRAFPALKRVADRVRGRQTAK